MGDFWYSRIMGGRLRQCLLLALAGGLLFSSPASSGPYLSSAHGGGNGSNGAQRGVMVTNGYAAGNCAHCHEQHASLGGAEPTPPAATGKQGYELFDANHTSQTVNFCYHCHDSTTTVSQNSIINHSYSYRAGGYTGGGGLPDDIKEEFSLSGGQTSVHQLGLKASPDDILLAISTRWNYSTNSNPCGACHNPHAAQRDNKGGTRGYPVARPSLHSTDNNSWGIWGDTSAERMNNYSTLYKNPYDWNSTSTYEPDSAATQNNGTTVTDHVTFCQDCHSIAGGLSSTVVGDHNVTGNPNTAQNTIVVNWATSDKHGLTSSDGALSMFATGANMYSTTVGQNVLSCTDCHEPHGSQNKFLIRQAVMGGLYNTTAIAFGGNANDFGLLCRECHEDDVNANAGAGFNTRGTGTTPLPNGWDWVHHQAGSGDRPYNSALPPLNTCTNCHTSGAATCGTSTRCNPINCGYCHYHSGSDTTWMTNRGLGAQATGRRTF